MEDEEILKKLEYLEKKINLIFRILLNLKIDVTAEQEITPYSLSYLYRYLETINNIEKIVPNTTKSTKYKTEQNDLDRLSKLKEELNKKQDEFKAGNFPYNEFESRENYIKSLKSKILDFEKEIFGKQVNKLFDIIMAKTNNYIRIWNKFIEITGANSEHYVKLFSEEQINFMRSRVKEYYSDSYNLRSSEYYSEFLRFFYDALNSFNPLTLRMLIDDQILEPMELNSEKYYQLSKQSILITLTAQDLKDEILELQNKYKMIKK
ncbi:MAG: hypothetical protein ACTSU2_01890 [Promethearchaeota archaeon]